VPAAVRASQPQKLLPAYDRPGSDLNDMEIPTFIRRQMD